MAKPSSDPALETLLLPFSTGALRWPEPEQVTFLRARANGALPLHALRWRCEQSFRPTADGLSRMGIVSKPLLPTDGKKPTLVLCLPGRQREEARSLLARALALADEGATVLASASNTDGARSLESDLSHMAGNVQSLSKNKCRAFWVTRDAAAMDSRLLGQWLAADAPRPIAGGRFQSRPGLFAWDRVDAASAMLAACLPDDVAGAGADLGAGYGFLSAHVVERFRAVTAMSLFEAEARALALARLNLQGARVDGRMLSLAYHWHDVAGGVPGRFDFIVSNPPFHEGRADAPALGRAFIAAAAAALKPEGRLWLVANRHLPYEAALAAGFSSVRVLRDQDGFKVFEASGARA